MASVVAMVGGGLFNAVAFAGAGYLFQKFNKDGYDDEVRRHNLALEKLVKARQEWNQKDIEHREKIEALRKEKKEANADFKEINKALRNYKKATLIFDETEFTQQPQLWDFYNPSDEMKEYMTLSIGTIGLVSGWAGQKIISKLIF